ncbi:MAG: SCO family protein [Hyphomicrobiales bacterium]
MNFLRLSGIVGALLLLAAAPLDFARAETKVVTEAPAAKDDVRRPFMLRDVRSRVLTDQDFLGNYLLVYFGYTHCPDVCPTSLLTISEVMKGLGEDAKGVVPIFISVDPDRDTPEHLLEYTSAFDDRIVALTGPQQFVDAAIASYNGYYKKVPSKTEPADYTMDHTASIAFVDPAGKLITRFAYGATVEEIVARVRETMTATRSN